MNGPLSGRCGGRPSGRPSRERRERRCRGGCSGPSRWGQRSPSNLRCERECVESSGLRCRHRSRRYARHAGRDRTSRAMRKNLDFVGSAANLEQLGVAGEHLDDPVAHVAGAAFELHGVHGHVRGRAGAVELARAGLLDGEGDPGPLRRELPHEQRVDEGLAPCTSWRSSPARAGRSRWAAPTARALSRSARSPRGSGRRCRGTWASSRSARPSATTWPPRARCPASSPPRSWSAGHEHVVEEDLARGRGVHAHLLHGRAGGEALGASLDDERAHAPRSSCARSPAPALATRA